MTTRNLVALAVLLVPFATARATELETPIPRPEHPTPDAVRAHWLNLNGPWQFRFDPKDEGATAGWSRPDAPGFDRTITVPFGWESALSGIHEVEYRGVAWYRRTFSVPADWPITERVWLRFGAVDWRADVWVNGKAVVNHEGGYSPFEANITDSLQPGQPAVVTVRVFDPTDPELPTGKQVGWYTPTSGIWQTVWLEARPKTFIKQFTITPRLIDDGARGAADVEVEIEGAKAEACKLTARSDDHTFLVVGATSSVRLSLTVDQAKLWTPETPHLYDLTLELQGPDGSTDTVKTYFGLRTIARGKYGDEPYERILLNGKPIYLRAALDQSFNPQGLYTAPDDAFLKGDLTLAKSMGLNALRIHIKPDEPRRLYWADKLGVMILEDMPNTWRQSAKARLAWMETMRAVVQRDRNHPAIIAWIAFNETWGLGTPDEYKTNRDTQDWVGAMVTSIRHLDPTRLVEDHSPCNYDHIENTDLNSWHFYIDDHDGARRHIAEVVDQTKPGSAFNYLPGRVQSTAPLINSEYGNVSSGSGDRDVSWGFRDLTTQLRRHPKIQGYVYTELTDIEWEHNGFANYDRTPKRFHYDAFVPEMEPKELNGADFIGADAPPAIVGAPGATITVPVFISHYSERTGPPKVRWWVSGWDDHGDMVMVVPPETRAAEWVPYGVREQKPIQVTLPRRPFVGALILTLRGENKGQIAANYVNLVVQPPKPLPRVERLDEREVALRFAPDDFGRSHWSGPPSSPPPGKAYGRGKGFLEYRVQLPKSVVAARPESFGFRFEMASKATREKVDMPERANPQDYPQTDDRKWPSTLEVAFNGQVVYRATLPDDPADARGVLSHLAGVEHGSYGELIEGEGRLSDAVKADLAAGKPLTITLSVPDDAKNAGGLCLFGATTGRFPFDPTLTIATSRPIATDLGVKPDAPVAIDSVASRRSVLLAAGDSPRGPTVWTYTTTDPGPGPGWTEPAFNDSKWQRGSGGFGSNPPGLRVRTAWQTPAIWLRATVDLPAALQPDDSLTLHLFHDEDVEIFVNGKPLYQAGGFLVAYRDVALDDAQKALFHPGANVVAVVCRQTSGGQGIDVGLTLLRGQ